MALSAYAGVAPVGGSTISVFLGGTQVLATLYEDLGGLTPLPNPFTADTNTGTYYYVAETAAYDTVVGQPDASTLPVRSLRLSVIFNGTSPGRTVTLLVDDPDTLVPVILQTITY